MNASGDQIRVPNDEEGDRERGSFTIARPRGEGTNARGERIDHSRGGRLNGRGQVMTSMDGNFKRKACIIVTCLVVVLVVIVVTIVASLSG